jgi:hypothetical protein
MAVSTKSKVTTNHEEIRRWASARGGYPTAISIPKRGDTAGLIRISFPGDREQGSRDEISWDEWFKKFDEAELALLYQEHTAGGEHSNFNKLVSRESVDEVEFAVGGKGRSASRRRLRPPAEVGAIVPSRDGSRQRNVARTIPHKVSKKSAIAAAIVPDTKKQQSAGDVPWTTDSQPSLPGGARPTTRRSRNQARD